MLTILLYSHHFAIESPNERYVTAIESYTRQHLLSIKYHKLWNGRVIKKLDKVFAVKTKSPLIYRFHINCLQEFLDWMKTHGYNDFKCITQPMYEPVSCEFNIVTNKEPWGIQPEIISYLVGEGEKKVIEMQTGGGKGLINGTPVRTINGWTNIEDLKIGDKVMGETGEFHSVTGVYPQGVKDLYRFTFKDGRTIVTDKEHLWLLSREPLSTQQIIENNLVLSTESLYNENKIFYLPVLQNGEYKECILVKVEKLPYTGETTCISVDNPTKLFVTKDYIVTHNTLCTLFAISEIKQRTVLCIKPMYIQRWMDDLASKDGIFNLKPHELCKVQGTMELASIIRLALDDNLTFKFIIISNKTLHIYYKEYINGENMDKYHGVKPFDLFKVLKAGVRIIDEAHQDFHQCFKTDLFSHIPKTIELSATLIPDDIFMRKMYETVYPKEKRLGGGIYRKYVKVRAIPYSLDKDNPSVIITTQKGMTSYSQGSFEQSIMNNKLRLTNYLNMIEYLTNEYWTTQRVTDYKLLIFASRVDMCRLIVERLQKIYPQLKITKYTEEEDYKILPEMDIIVSTPISAGTAVDIPKLQVCINTVALGATQANLQMIGRLRELRDTDVKPTFVYTYCTDISKHIEYHVKRRDHTFKNKVLEYIEIPYQHKI